MELFVDGMGREQKVALRMSRREILYQVGDEVLYDPLNPQGLSQSWTARIGKIGIIMREDEVFSSREPNRPKRWYIEFEHQPGREVTPSRDNYTLAKQVTPTWEV